MKKILSLFIAMVLVVLCVPTIMAEEVARNVYAQQTVSIMTLGAFEEDHTGYVPSAEIFDGRTVRAIRRDGKDNTSTKFNYYYWSNPMPDVNGKPIPLSTANYIIIDYYYHSPDAEPALLGNKVGWLQGRVTPEKNIYDVAGFAWSTTIESRNGMVANKWDKLVLPVDEYVKDIKANMTRRSEYYLHQMKLFPLLKGDMGKDDVLYFGDITIQSWDPDTESGISERSVAFYATPEAYEKGEAAFHTIKVKDLESIVIPEYTISAPENYKFNSWQSVKTGKIYLPGASLQHLLGQDDAYIPIFDVSVDFSSFENSYINGYEDGTFLPQNNITRAEACKILASIVDPNGKLGGGETAFEDIKPEDWFYKSVTALESLGAFDDVYGGKFLSSEKITRAEFVQLIYAISDPYVENMKLTYLSDVKTNAKYFDSVMYAVSKGIVTGYEDGTFKPNNKITRAEAVTVINRMLGREWNGQGAARFSDIEGHWAKGQIIASATSKADGAWQLKGAELEYVLEGTSAKDYITALHTQSKNLSGDAIRRGVDVISEQMKKDVLSTPNTAEIYPDRIGKNTYYISEKNGNDDNDGKTPETALKTITGLYKKLRFPGKGTTILFERGGTYRGQITVTTGLTYGSYGEGDKPIISGSKKNYADASLWEETDVKNIYKLKENITNAGIIVFDHADDAHGNYDDLYGQNRIFGKNITSYIELSKDLEFFSCNNIFYLCSTEGNPGARFKDIEIGTRIDVFDGAADDIVIDNVHVKHTGAHGVGLGSGKNVVVTNCEFSWLGGSLLGSYGETTTQYGNAVELYGNCDGFYVTNNWMWQIYDTGITHQGKNLNMKNIEYTGNLIEYCHWAIECWMTQPDSKGSLHNYLAHYNVLRNGGYGWGTIVTKRPSNSMLYCTYNFTVESSNMVTEYNIFDRGAGELVHVDSRAAEVLNSNIYIQHEGAAIGDLKGNASTSDLTAPFSLNKNVKDKSPIYVLINER